MKIVIDSREQNPFQFDFPDCGTIVGSLYAGYYTLYGFESSIAVERKELGDLIGCLTSGRDRFMRELERLRGYDSAVVVVESEFADIVNGNYRSRLNSESAVQSIISIMQKYRMPFFFAGGHKNAERFTYDFLRHAHRHAMERFKSLNNK